MAEKKQERRTSTHGSGDAISHLPEEIINLILAHLPIKEAVRTSILSMEWRHRWLSIPDLVFNGDCFPYDHEADELLECLKIMNVVDHVLLHHIGPIHKFSFNLDTQAGDTAFFLHTNRIDRWIDLLLKNGIKSLFLVCYLEQFHYKMPSNLFDCQDLCLLELFGCTLIVPLTFNGLHNLRTLKLNAFKLEVPPTCKGFPSLTDLKFSLQNVLPPVKEAGDIARLISKCPLLERLTIDIFDCGPLEIHAPNLRYLDLIGRYEDLSFGRCPLLADVSLKCTIHPWNNHLVERDNCNLVRILGPLHGIQRLEIIDLTCFSEGNVPKVISTPYYHLKCLSVDINFKDSKEILTTVCICRSSPNLQDLKVFSIFSSFDTCDDDNSEEEEEEEEEVFSWFWELDSLFNHLQLVEIHDIGGKMPELEFIRLLFAMTPLLDTMSITIDICSRESEKSRILKDLAQFQRASARAKIIYL